ncbi:MFS transporter [Pusillimonas sp. NJUB218]|uniref:MFS transporter n=1 Tax=Pusillimonas sp. NJUB218 TaxID=2023230 RepID=UPI000F4C2F2D|nr:MFS transporter [Pusillimonas sp. NJUB218]ROT46550.1 MFS transporter [Pusillimonas sp. NJUB218]
MTAREVHPAPAAGFYYGALGLPLAFVALPLYVYMPAYYAEQFGTSLAALGAVLLFVRIFDAVTDPVMGYVADRLFSVSRRALQLSLGVGCLVLLAGFTGLFFPPLALHEPHTALLAWCALMLMLTYLAYSALTITHQAWAARLKGGDEVQSRWVSWREAATLVGVMLASVLPTVVGMSATAVVLGVALWLGWLALGRAPAPVALDISRAGAAQGAVTHKLSLHYFALPWRGPAFRGLIGVFLVNGIASAIPATLLLFFVNDRLQAAGWEGAFLAIYFACAAASLPVWVKVVSRVGLGASWAAGMTLAVVSFFGAAFLGAGDTTLFLLICAASGFALGADLALPTPLLARVIRTEAMSADAEGAYFGWWNSASKLNLALAAGLVLPMLQWLGYTPGQTDEQGLRSLSLAYAVLPCCLKLVALYTLWLWRRRWDKEH